jgi:hypothetical protein
MLDPERIVVKLGNKLDGESDQVKATLEGVAALSAGLIAIGQDGLITPDDEMRGFESLIETMSSSFADQSTLDKFNERHGDSMDEHYDAAVKGLGSSAFKGFIWNLGAMDTLYRLTPTNDQDENELTLTIVGFD